MIVDTSAIAAVLFEEEDGDDFADAINKSVVTRISAATFVETAIVADSHAGSSGGRDLDAFIRQARIEIVPVTEEQAHVARQAYAEYGRGRHKAHLNFGDCFAYALSKVTGEPLLFKGRDFLRTDVVSALKRQ